MWDLPRSGVIPASPALAGGFLGHQGILITTILIGAGNFKKKIENYYNVTMEYYSAIKKNEIMSFAATLIGLEIIILREVSQTEEDQYDVISLLHVI